MESMLGLFNKRNVFDLSHERKFSCDMGLLIPILVEDVVPGDTFKCQTDMLIRLAPMLAPMMHRVSAFTHYFFVPNRLLWKNWESFITGGPDGDDSSEAPYISLTSVANGSLADYFGIPSVSVPGHPMQASALPFRAYNLIFNEWFRDQNLQEKVVVSTDDGEDTTTPIDVLRRNWEKDYFTSALPWPQRGAAVTLGLGDSADVTVSSMIDIPVGRHDSGSDPTGAFCNVGSTHDSDTPPDTIYTEGISNHPDASLLRAKGTADGYGTADLSTATALTINELRLAFQIQKYMERSARGGSRYVESILSHFGVRSSDARLQRPEFLGGGRSPIVVSEVLQTAPAAGGSTPLGQMAGHGITAHRSHEFTKSFEEHGWIIGVVSIMPRTAYQQGLPRRWTRATKYDYYWPEFAHLGEQAVLNKELFVGDDSYNDQVFGYQGRYDEYRRRESSVHGDFRGSLDFWHLGRIFDSRPNLNSDFVGATPAKRAFAVTSEHVCWIQLVNQIQAIRPLPKTGEPGLIDHN